MGLGSPGEGPERGEGSLADQAPLPRRFRGRHPAHIPVRKAKPASIPSLFFSVSLLWGVAISQISSPREPRPESRLNCWTDGPREVGPGEGAEGRCSTSQAHPTERMEREGAADAPRRSGHDTGHPHSYTNPGLLYPPTRPPGGGRRCRGWRGIALTCWALDRGLQYSLVNGCSWHWMLQRRR